MTTKPSAGDVRTGPKKWSSKTAERDQAAELLLAEMTGWASGLLRVKQLRALNGALGARALATTLEYYEGQPNLAKYTVDQELSRMRYAVRTPSGEQLRGADDVRKYHESLAEDEQTSMPPRQHDLHQQQAQA